MLNRRRLLGLSVAGLAGLELIPRRAAASSPGPADEPWLVALAALPYSTFLDIRGFAPDGTPFRKVANLHRALTEAHRIPVDQVGIAFGAGSSSIAFVLGAQIWTEYRLGEKVSATARTPDEAKSLRAEPGVWASRHGEEIATMRAMGVRVLACRNSMWRWARDLAAVSGEAPERVNEKLIAGLHDGVEPVPAMIAAAALAQHRGLSYVAIG